MEFHLVLFLVEYLLEALVGEYSVGIGRIFGKQPLKKIHVYVLMVFDGDAAARRAYEEILHIDLYEEEALREILNRLLWKASVKAGELNNPWNNKNNHYIHYSLLYIIIYAPSFVTNSLHEKSALYKPFCLK